MDPEELKNLAELIAARVAEIIPLVDKKWLKAGAAARYSSIPKKRLVKLAYEGKIKGFPDSDNKRGDWIFDRDSLDILWRDYVSKYYREAPLSTRLMWPALIPVLASLATAVLLLSSLAAERWAWRRG